MRYFIFLYFLFMTVYSGAQGFEINGTYTAGFMGVERIDFVGKDSFYFNGFYCSDGLKGKGVCEIRDNYLILNFENSNGKVKKIPRPAVIQSKNSEDSIADIRITVFFNDGTPVPFADVEISGKERIISKTISDKNGFVSFPKISSGYFPMYIETAGYKMIEPVKIELKEFADYTITIFHNDHSLKDNTLNSGEQYIYEIDTLTEDIIRMRPQYSPEPFREYKRSKEQGSE